VINEDTHIVSVRMLILLKIGIVTSQYRISDDDSFAVERIVVCARYRRQ